MITRNAIDVDETLKALEAAWKKNPGMNLVQIVLAIALIDPDNPNKTVQFDPRYVQNQEWIANSKVYPYLQTSANTDS